MSHEKGTRGACSREGCELDVYAKGLCNKHWQQERYHKDPDKARAMRRSIYHRSLASSRAALKAKYQRRKDKAKAYRVARYWADGHPRKRTSRTGVYTPIYRKKSLAEKRADAQAKALIDSPFYVRPAAPAKVKESDRDWWKLTDETRPRHWSFV